MAAKKEVVATINLVIPVGKANPAPPIGSALGQRGVNIMEFCKQFNDMKSDYNPGTPVPTVISVYKDKSFTFVTKCPPVTYFIKEELKLKSGSRNPGKDSVGKITGSQLHSIAEKKMKDLNASDLEAAVAMIRGSALSMGLEIVE